MKPDETKRWRGLRDSARQNLETRDYSENAIAKSLATTGVAADAAIAARSDLEEVWIPGVELFSRRVFQQKDRGYFAELTRVSEGVLGTIGLAPRQWASALMHRASAKGFHIHPPFIPDDKDPEEWFQDLYVDHSSAYERRHYDREQWDVMFFLTSICEIVLVDERVGLPRRVMRFTIHGDSLPGANNAAVVIPPGVAHALRNIGKDELLMVYGTSTTFDPDWEGRIESGVERSELPSDWKSYVQVD